MLLEHAEAARERDLLLRSQLLVAEEDHLVVEETAGDLHERIVGQRLRQVDAGDLGPEMLADPGNGNHVNS